MLSSAGRDTLTPFAILILVAMVALNMERTLNFSFLLEAGAST
jgi:hypothetical protein